MIEKESKFTPGGEAAEGADTPEAEVMPLAQAVKTELLSDRFKQRIPSLGEYARKASEPEVPESQQI